MGRPNADRPNARQRPIAWQPRCEPAGWPARLRVSSFPGLERIGRRHLRRRIRIHPAGSRHDRGGHHPVRRNLLPPQQHGERRPYLHYNMANAAHEAARALAAGAIATKAESTQLVERNLINWGVTFTVHTTLPDPRDPATNNFTVVVTAPLSEAAVVDYLGVFKGGTSRPASAPARRDGRETGAPSNAAAPRRNAPRERVQGPALIGLGGLTQSVAASCTQLLGGHSDGTAIRPGHASVPAGASRCSFSYWPPRI